jgi:hypothetical protein
MEIDHDSLPGRRRRLNELIPLLDRLDFDGLRHFGNVWDGNWVVCEEEMCYACAKERFVGGLWKHVHLKYPWGSQHRTFKTIQGAIVLRRHVNT